MSLAFAIVVAHSNPTTHRLSVSINPLFFLLLLDNNIEVNDCDLVRVAVIPLIVVLTFSHMIVCLCGVPINISRLFPFACYLIVLVLVQSNLVLAVHAAPDFAHASSNRTLILALAGNYTNHTDVLAPTCVVEVLDYSLPYFSLPYRLFAGSLVVPITFCAIFGNILVIYVIKHYASLRITGNVFLASLAVADVGVSTLAMTFYGLQLIQGRWILGAVSERSGNDFFSQLESLRDKVFFLAFEHRTVESEAEMVFPPQAK